MTTEILVIALIISESTFHYQKKISVLYFSTAHTRVNINVQLNFWFTNDNLPCRRNIQQLEYLWIDFTFNCSCEASYWSNHISAGFFKFRGNASIVISKSIYRKHAHYPMSGTNDAKLCVKTADICENTSENCVVPNVNQHLIIPSQSQSTFGDKYWSHRLVHRYAR